MARKTKAEALATRNRILDGAERMFCTHGVARTSLHEIADSVGLTRGAVYWHFHGKFDLLQALWERCHLPLEQEFRAIDAEHADDPLRRIAAKGRRVFDRIAHDARTRNLMNIVLLRCEMTGEIGRARRRMLAVRDRCLDEMAAEFAQAVRGGQLPASLDAGEAAIGMHALVDGLTWHWLLAPRRFDLLAVGTDLLAAFLHGLQGGKSRRRGPVRTAPRRGA